MSNNATICNLTSTQLADLFAHLVSRDGSGIRGVVSCQAYRHLQLRGKIIRGRGRLQSPPIRSPRDTLSPRSPPIPGQMPHSPSSTSHNADDHRKRKKHHQGHQAHFPSMLRHLDASTRGPVGSDFTGCLLLARHDPLQSVVCALALSFCKKINKNSLFTSSGRLCLTPKIPLCLVPPAE